MNVEDHSQKESNHEDLNVIAGEYVLGTLDAREHRAIDLRLPYDPLLQAAVQEWETRLSPLVTLVAPVQPSASLWTRIANSINAASKPVQKISTRWWHWNSLVLWRGLAGASFSAVAVLCAVLLNQNVSPSPKERYFVVLAAPQNQTPGWLVQAHDAGQLRLVPLGSMPVPAENSLQFWTKADDWSAPVSLGLVSPGQTMEVPVDQLPPLQANQLFELTLEPAGGSPSGKPTGPIQFIGRAVQL